VAGGGSCGQGATSAVFGKYTTVSIGGTPGHFNAYQFTATVIAGGVGSVIAGGKFKNGAETAAFGYLFNQLGPHGRDPNIRGDIGVQQAKDMFIERGYPILADQVEATIDGYPTRKYDFLVQNSDGSLRGVEVKSTIGDFFKLNPRQVAFDAAVYESGAKSAFGTIASVGYVGVGMGNVPKFFQSVALQTTLSVQGVKFDVITGLKVQGK
jgi:hypothetical protein